MSGKSIVIKIEGDGESAKRALEMVKDHLRETGEQGKHSANELAEAMERVKRSLEYVGIYMGIREGVDLLKEMIAGSVELGVELGHLHQQTGISTENLSVMKYMADKTGVSFEALTKGFKKFSSDIRDADEGSKKAVDSFARLGISQSTVKKSGGDMYEMLGLVADRFKTMPDGPLKAASAVDLFGKGGLALIPILNEGREGIAEFKSEAESLGLILDEQGIAKMEAMHGAMVKLKGSVTGAGLAFTQGLTPGVIQMLGVVNSGKNEMTAFQEFGNLVARGMAAAAMTVYGLAAAYHYLLAADPRTGHRDENIARADELVDKANSMRDIFIDGPKPMEPEKHHPGGLTDPDLKDQSEGKGQEHILTAEAKLQEASAKQIATMRKAAADSELAFFEAQHKLLLMSDADFYAAKLTLERDAITGEENAIVQQIATMTELQTKQHADKNLKRGKDGKSPEELQTAAKLVELNTQLAGLQERMNRATTASNLGDAERAQQVKLATAQLAAKLEEETNTTITARLALMRIENDLALQKIANTAGNDSPEYRQRQALDGVLEAKLRIADVDRQIRDSEADNKRAVDALADAAAKDPRFKKAATAEINALNKAEAQHLQSLVAQYDALAQTLGGPFLQTAKNLHAELDKLNTPNKKDDAAFTKTLADGVESMADRMAEGAMRGKQSFSDMARSIEQDVVRLALKLAMQKWLTPLLMGLGSGGAGVPSVPDSMYETHADGGVMNGPSLVGERGPELWSPPVRGGTVTPHETLAKIANGGSQGISVTSNIINQSSQPVTAKPSQVSYDAEMKQFVIHTILEDHAQGGPIAQAGRS